MSSTAIQAIVAVATFLCSVGASSFIAGMKWGTTLQELRYIDNRLTKIEALFEYRVKGNDI
jgi:hypothetical protein